MKKIKINKDMLKQIREQERKLEKIIAEQSKDKKTERFKFNSNQLKTLYNKQNKKPDYVLVQYLRNSHKMDFQLCKIISGNIIVIDNKGHKLNPKLVWRHGKYFWYIIGEWDKEPIGPRYLEKIKKLQRNTDNHPILMKMVLGAVQKKEEMKTKKYAGWIIGIIVVGIILWIIFGGK